MQLDAEGRGFSFRRDEPLDMRMDQSRGPSVADLLRDVEERSWPTSSTASAKNGFRAASRARSSTRGASRRSTPPGGSPRSSAAPCRTRGHQRIDPATRTFQALRIWVNRELDGLDASCRPRRARLAGERAARGDHVSLARGPDREAHVPRAGAGGRRACAILTKQPLVPRGRGSGAQPAGPQRQAARD